MIIVRCNSIFQECFHVAYKYIIKHRLFTKLNIFKIDNFFTVFGEKDR